MTLVFSVALMIALLAFVAGIVLAAFVGIRASFRTLGYWDAQFGSLAQRFAKRAEAGERARREENDTALGRLANRLLQVGTALGLVLALTFGLLRLIGVPIHAL